MSQSITRENFDEWIVPVYAPVPLIPARGEGSCLWDWQGKEYIDFAGGTVVSALGHAHPELREVLDEQVSESQHISSGYTNEPVLRLARKLIDIMLVDRVSFYNSGAEASEVALKLAHKLTHDRYGSHRNGIVVSRNAFHGRTLFTVSAGGQPAYSQDSAPLLPGIRHTAYDDISSANALIDDAARVVIIKLIQREGGAMPASNASLQGLRESCDRHNALPIFNEVRTGVGHTGELYARMHCGVTPDLLTTAKTLGDSFPVGTLLTTEECVSVMTVGAHGTIYGGNPLASAVAGKVLDLINTPKMLNGVKQHHDWFAKHLNSVNHRYSLFNEVRSLGFLTDCILNTDYAERTKQISQEAMKAGVTVLITGGNVVRSAPAFNVSKEEMTTGLDRFAATYEHSISRDSS